MKAKTHPLSEVKSSLQIASEEMLHYFHHHTKSKHFATGGWEELEPVEHATHRSLSQCFDEWSQLFPHIRLLLPEPKEWESRKKPGCDLAWHARRLVCCKMAGQYEALRNGEILPGTGDTGKSVEWWFEVSAARLKSSLQETILESLPEHPTQVRRILRFLYKKTDQRATIVVTSHALQELLSNWIHIASWRRVCSNLHVIVCLDDYTLEDKRIEELLLNPKENCEITLIRPPDEARLRQHLEKLVMPPDSDVFTKASYTLNLTSSNRETDRIRNALVLLPVTQRLLRIHKQDKGFDLEKLGKTCLDLLEQTPEADPTVQRIVKDAKARAHAEMQEDFDNKLVKNCIENGVSFVAVLGRGLNDLCGIPNNRQIASYLVYTAYVWLTTPGKKGARFWPTCPPGQELEDAVKNAYVKANSITAAELGQISVLQALLTVFGKQEDKQPTISEPDLWPPLLIALCEIDGQFDQALSESFQSRLTSSAQPHAVHTRLSHLLRPLRIRAIVDMVGGGALHAALNQCGRPFTVIRSISPSQPAMWRDAPSNQLAVVEWPSSVERSAFLSFADPGNLEATPPEVNAFWSWLHPSESAVHPDSCMLILGVTKNRWWISLLRSLLPRLRGDSCLFLVTEKTSVRESIATEFKPYLDEKKLFLRVASHPDILLYELYLHTTHSLPPALCQYGFQNSMPPQAMPVAYARLGEFENQISKLCKLVDPNFGKADGDKKTKEVEKTDWDPAQNPPNLHAKHGRHPEHPNLLWLQGRAGVTAVASRAFKELAHANCRCIWVGLNDFATPLEVEKFVTSQFAIMMGVTKWLPTALASYHPLQRYLELVQGDTQPDWPGFFEAGRWVVFVEARGVPGLDAGVVRPMLWSRPSLLELERSVLGALPKSGVKVVYLPMSRLFRRDLLKLMSQYCPALIDELNELAGNVNQWMPCGDICPKDLEPGDANEDSVENLEPLAEEWINSSNDEKEKWQRTVFLYALTLFRENRHLSAVTAEAVHSPLDWIGRLFDIYTEHGHHQTSSLRDFAVHVEPKYRLDLSDRGIIRWQRGGFIHMPWLLRESLRRAIESGLKNKVEKSPDTGRSVTEIKSAIHFRIGEWYAEAFRSSYDPVALVECLHHRAMAIRSSVNALPPFSELHKKRNVRVERIARNYPRILALLGFTQLAKGIRMASTLGRYSVDMASRLELSEKIWSENLQTKTSWQEPLAETGWLAEARNLRQSISFHSGETIRETALGGNLSRHSIKAAAYEARLRCTIVSGKSCTKERTHVQEAMKTVAAAMAGTKPGDSLFVGKNGLSCIRGIQRLLLGSLPKKGGLAQWQAAVKTLALGYSELTSHALYQAENLAWTHTDWNASLNKNGRGPRRAAQKQAEEIWWHEVITNAGIARRLSWLMTVHDLELQLGINLHINSCACIAFARVHAFAEAHRTLNVATGYLARMNPNNRDVERGRLMLRRAELFLLQARALKVSAESTTATVKRRMAHLQDALYWSRLGSESILANDRHPDWLVNASRLEAEILCECQISCVAVPGGDQFLRVLFDRAVDLAKGFQNMPHVQERIQAIEQRVKSDPVQGHDRGSKKP